MQMYIEIKTVSLSLEKEANGTLSYRVAINNSVLYVSMHRPYSDW